MKDLIKLLAGFAALMLLMLNLGCWNATKVGITTTQYWAFVWLQFKWVWGGGMLLYGTYAILFLCYEAACAVVKRRRQRQSAQAEDWDL